MTIKRKNIPTKKADEVMFQSDLLCCVCESRGDHVHHLNNDPGNNDLDNLVLLCFKHHSEVTSRGGLSRRLSPELLRKYRTLLYRKVETKRKLPELEQSPKVNSKMDEEHLFQLMLDAVTIREIQEISQGIDFDEDDKVLDAINNMTTSLRQMATVET